jgi:hypothetical protein
MSHPWTVLRRVAKVIAAAALVYLVLLVCAIVWWPRSDEFMGFVLRKFELIEKSQWMNPAKRAPLPTDRSPRPMPEAAPSPVVKS